LSVFEGTDRVVVLSLYPFPIKHLVKPMETRVNAVLNRQTSMKKVFKRESNRWSYVGVNRPVYFEVDFYSDVGSRGSLIQYWAERLAGKLDESDAVIFAVPLPSPFGFSHYSDAVYNAAKNVMYAVYQRYPRAVPFRVAFYPSWNHCLPSFSIRQTIKAQAKSLFDFERKSPLVVPFGTLFQDFDTEYILPQLLKGIHRVRFLKPTPEDKSLVHSFTELLKVDILTVDARPVKMCTEPLL